VYHIALLKQNKAQGGHLCKCFTGRKSRQEEEINVYLSIDDVKYYTQCGELLMDVEYKKWDINGINSIISILKYT
jgi:hypothetical protein